MAVEEHRVREGETLESIAKGAGMTREDLAFFNWGTKDAKEIDTHLVVDVGCTKKSADGKTFVFSDGDAPGLLYVPRDWRAERLPTRTTHVVRVRTIGYPKRGYLLSC